MEGKEKNRESRKNIRKVRKEKKKRKKGVEKKIKEQLEMKTNNCRTDQQEERTKR